MYGRGGVVLCASRLKHAFVRILEISWEKKAKTQAGLAELAARFRQNDRVPWLVAPTSYRFFCFCLEPCFRNQRVATKIVGA